MALNNHSVALGSWEKSIAEVVRSPLEITIAEKVVGMKRSMAVVMFLLA